MHAIQDTTNYHKNNFGGNGYSGNESVLGSPDAEIDFLIIGDSKARQFAYGLDTYLKEKQRKAILISRDGCPMIPGVVRYNEPRHCDDQIKQVLALAQQTNIPIISLRGWNYWETMEHDGKPFSVKFDDGPQLLAKLYMEFHEQLLNNAENRQIYLIGNNAGFGSKSSVAECLSRPSWLGLKCLESNAFSAKDYQIPKVERLIKRATEQHPNITYIPMVNLFCPSGSCSQFSPKGEVIFSDPTHLSKIGSLALAERLLLFTKLVPGVDSTPEPVVEPTLEPVIDETIEITLETIKSTQSVSNALQLSSASEHADMIKNITELMTNQSDRDKLVNALWDGVGVNKDRTLSAKLSESFAQKYEDPVSIYRIGLAYYVGEGVEKNPAKSIKYFSHSSQSNNHTVKLYLVTMYLDDSFEGYSPKEAIKLVNAYLTKS